MRSFSSKSHAGPLLSITHGRDGVELALKFYHKIWTRAPRWARYLKRWRPLPIEFVLSMRT